MEIKQADREGNRARTLIGLDCRIRLRTLSDMVYRSASVSVLVVAWLLLPGSGGTRAGQPEVSPVAARFPSVREQVRLTLPDANADTVLARLGAFARTDPALESLHYVLCEEHFQKRRTPNYALLLLVHLLDRNPEAANDTMSAAIALANNYYYPNGDAAVRRLILADVDAQWKFYVRLVAWQQRVAAPAPLARMPIEAKVVWAARERTYAPTRNQKAYLQRLPRIEEIESMHEVVAKETALAEARSLAQWSARIQKWFLSQRVPRSKLPPDKQHIFFSDLYAYYRANKRFPTKHCVATATFFWVIYRSVGMPVFTYYQNFRTAGTDGSGVLHEWPAYYDPDRRIWESGQKSNPWPRHAKTDDVAVDLEIFRPLWHHYLATEATAFCKTAPRAQVGKPAHIGGRCRAQAYVERTRVGLLRDYVLRGMPESDMKRIFLFPVWTVGPSALLTGRK